MLLHIVFVDNEFAIKNSRDKSTRVPDSNVTFHVVNWQHLVYMTINQMLLFIVYWALMISYLK